MDDIILISVPLTSVPLYRKPPAHCWTGQPFQAASSEYWEMGWQMSASSPSPEKIIKISWPNFKGNYENSFLTLTRIRVSSLGIERTLFSTSASVTSIKEQLEFWSIMGNMPCPVTQGWHYYWNSVFLTIFKCKYSPLFPGVWSFLLASLPAFSVAAPPALLKPQLMQESEKSTD